MQEAREKRELQETRKSMQAEVNIGDYIIGGSPNGLKEAHCDSPRSKPNPKATNDQGAFGI